MRAQMLENVCAPGGALLIRTRDPSSISMLAKTSCCFGKTLHQR